MKTAGDRENEGGDVTVEVRRAQPSDRRILDAFFQRVWSGAERDEAQADASAAIPMEQPGTGEGARKDEEEAPAFIFVRNGEVVGYLGTLGTAFAVGPGPAREGHWLKGFWVLPEYRNGPVGFSLARQATKELDVVGASLVARPARRLFEAVGLTEVGTLFNRLWILRPARMLGRLRLERIDLGGDRRWLRRSLSVLRRTGLAALAGAVLGVAIRIGTMLRAKPDPSVRLRRGWESVGDGALDHAWSLARGEVEALPARDGSAVRRRYRDPGGYRMVSAWREDQCVGWAVLKEPTESPDPRLEGVRVACLSDILFNPRRPRVGEALLREVDALASGMDVDAVICSGSHPVLEGALSRCGYLGVPGNLRFMYRGETGEAPPPELESWWLCRGDGRSDDTF